MNARDDFRVLSAETMDKVIGCAAVFILVLGTSQDFIRLIGRFL